MDSIRIDPFLHAVESMGKASNYLYLGLEDLTLELRLLKTFLLCTRICKDYVPSGYDDSQDSFFFYRLKNAVNGKERHFLIPDYGQLKDFFCSSMERLQCFKGEISERYNTWSSYCSYNSTKDQLMEFFDSVLVNMDDLLCRIPIPDGILLDQIEDLNGYLVFLKSFIRLAELQCFEYGQLKDLLYHIQQMALCAAKVSYTVGVKFDKQDAEECEVSKRLINEVLTRIDDSSIHETNTKVLLDSNLLRSSHFLSLETDKHIMGDFVDSLLFYVWKALTKDTSYMVSSSKDQMPILYEELRFLRTILKKHLDKVDELHEKVKDLIRVAVNEAGIVICSVLVYKLKEGSAKEALFSFLEKIQLIKVLTSTFIFSRTDELGFMDFLLKNLNELPSCKIDSIAFAKDQIQTVQENLVSLRPFLEKNLDQRNQHKNLQALRHRVVEVTFNSQNVIQSLVVGDITDSSLMTLNSITEEINHIKMEALKISEGDYCYEAQKVSRRSNPFPSHDSIPTINKVEVILYDETKTIMDKVIGGPKQFDIVSIVGMPGLGKTTLAKNVYNDPSVRELFHIHAWSVVSQVYKKKDLLLQILDCIVPHLSGEYSKMSETNLEEELRKSLMRNRYLIVLDDVWESEAWSCLERSFPNDVNGSRILLTSRHIDVAKKINPDNEPHRLRLLTEDESWKLLQKNLSCKEGYHFELGRQIANDCKGLPLTVVIVTGLLANLEQDGWEEIAKRLSLSALFASHECMDMLDLSYEYLPDYLKSCLLYFGGFEEDREISCGQLMRLWIAEGFVQESETKSLEDVANDYMNDLIGRNWVMVSKKNSLGGVKTCGIHDLLHEFCVIRCKKQNFLCSSTYDELVTFNCQSDIRRWCVKVNLEQFEKSRLFCPSLRSLLFFPHNCECDSNIYRSLPMFCIFKLLHVLDMWEVYIGNIFPSEICLLVELRYLAIGGFFDYIPSSVANLSNLEFLIIRRDLQVLMPNTIWNMQKLRYLGSSNAHFCLAKDTIERSSVLQNLHTFKSLRVDVGLDVENILRKMPNIRRLSCNLSLSSESTGDWKRILRIDILSRLGSLHVSLRGSQKLFDDFEFHFPLNLKKLKLTDFSSDIIPKISQLPKLEVLKLCCIAHEKNTWDMNEGLEFPQLKLLELDNPWIVRWTGSGDHFLLLQKLVLVSCQRLELVPSCLEDISTLETIEVRGCSNSAKSLLRKIGEEQEGLNVLIFF